MVEIVLVAHNLRSAHNVGSLLRTAEGLGVKKVYLTGYTPYPIEQSDERLPHIRQKVEQKIHKTALGAEHMIDWQWCVEIQPLIEKLKSRGFTVVALEQAIKSIPLPEFSVPPKIAVIVGREPHGIEAEILALCDKIVEIPMAGNKESFNVVQAAAMALYHFRFKL